MHDVLYIELLAVATTGACMLVRLRNDDCRVVSVNKVMMCHMPT